MTFAWIHSEYFRYYWNLSIHIYASIFLPKLVIFHLKKNYSHPRPEDVKWYHIVALICFSSMMDEVGHLFMWLLAMCKSFKKNILKPIVHFFGWTVCILLLNCKSCLCILNIKLYLIYDLQMFLPFFTFLIVSFDAQVFNLDEVQELKIIIIWSGMLVENQLAIDTWVSFWILYSFCWSVCLFLCPNLTI